MGKEELLVSDLGFHIYCYPDESKDRIDIEINRTIKEASSVADEGVKRLLQPVPAEKLFRISQKAFHERQLEFKVASKQITEQAATLFKAIGKTMPVMWQGQDNILVMDQVVIKPPYTSAILISEVEEERNDLLLARVQKLLQHHHQLQGGNSQKAK